MASFEVATIDSFAYCTRYVPYEAQPISLSAHLPLALQLVAGRCRNTRWRAWSTATQLWFIEAVIERPRTSAVVITAMQFYSRDAVPVAAGIWLRDANHRWWLQRVLELEEFHLYRLGAPLSKLRTRSKRFSQSGAHPTRRVAERRRRHR